jgi:hypothetical protein
MRRFTDYLVWLGIAVCCTFLACALAYPALAQEVTTGHGIICDTEAQLKRYAELYAKGDLSNLVAEKVNEEVGRKTACGIAHIAFVVGQSHGQVRTADGPYTVTQVLIIGVNLGHGWQRVRPFTQFTLVTVKEEGV